MTTEKILELAEMYQARSTDNHNLPTLYIKERV